MNRAALRSHLDSIVRSVFLDARVYAAGAWPSDGPRRFATYQRITGSHSRHLGGGAGIGTSQYDINCWADKSADAARMADRIREMFDNFRGTIGAVGAQVFVNGAFLEGNDDDFVPSTEASGAPRHGARLNLTIWHGETITPVT